MEILFTIAVIRNRNDGLSAIPNSTNINTNKYTMRSISIIFIFLFAALFNPGTTAAQENLINDLQLELVPYVDSKNPTDTLLDYYCVVTLADANATSTLFVKAGTKKDTTDRFDNTYYVTPQTISGTYAPNTETGIANSKDGNKVKIYIGRFHFELLYFDVTAKDEKGNSLGTKVKDMKKQD